MAKTKDDDILGGKAARKPRDTVYRRKNRGELHTLISKALPFICGPDGVANLHKLAEKLELTYAAVHKWMPPGEEHCIPPKRAEQIVDLSTDYADSGSAPKGFKPVSKADFLPYFF